MIESSAAVFLSYASEDTDAAAELAEALRRAGVQVWFDKDELRGGDRWDATIRARIQSCRLFLPIVSQNTEARPEGYFRREWRLAADRTHDMSTRVAFLVPVVVDTTSEVQADVPEAFRSVQWTRLPPGAPLDAFVTRIVGLLGGADAGPPVRAAPTARSAPRTTGVAASATPAPPPVPPVSTARSRRTVVTAAALASIAAAAVIGWTAWKHRPGAAASVPPAAAETSLAVLPFADLSQQHDQQYFSDGLAEELLDRLAQTPNLKVAARSSSFYFKDHPTTVAEMARALGVAHVLEGSVRKSGDSVRVAVELIRADTGFSIWSRTFDATVKDVFQVQDEIASAVVGALKGTLLPQARHGGETTTNPAAHDEYLIGLQFSNQVTLDGFRHAAAAFEKAIELDGGYAAAYAALAEAEVNIGDLTNDMGLFRTARQHADEALRHDALSVGALSTRGYVRIVLDLDWQGAIGDYEKALAIDPNSPQVERDYGFLLACMGRLPEAIALERRAVASDPLSDDGWNHLGMFLTFAGDLRGARQALERGLDVHPESNVTRYALAQVDLLEGHADQAMGEVAKITDEPTRGLLTAMAEYSLGHREAANRAMAKVVTLQGIPGQFDIAAAYAWIGDNDRAFEWLDRGFQQHQNPVLTKVYSMMRGIRSDPRYPALLKRLNLAE